MEKNKHLITPKRKHSRTDLLISTLGFILFLAFVELISPIIRPNRSASILFLNAGFIGLSIFAIVYFLSRNIYQEFEIDFIKKLFIIRYKNLIKNKGEKAISFIDLKYNYKQVAGFRTGVYWALSIIENDRTVVTLKDGDYGFSKDKFDVIVDNFNKLGLQNIANTT